MQKIILSVLSWIAVAGLSAQTVPNASFTDCNSNTRTVYQAIGAGKVLLVANAGTNCSICMGHAGQIGSYASNNLATVEVWGAITTKSGGSVTCTAVDNWVNSYGWSDVFSFVDQNKYWFNIAAPGFTVIDPRDSTIAYQGNSWNTARQTANSIAAVLSIAEVSAVNSVSVFANVIKIDFAKEVSGSINLYDLTGREVSKWFFSAQSAPLELFLNGTLPAGVYILRMSLNGEEIAEKIYL